ncbi:MAG: CMD domain-containing protein [Geminicoccales bacterium]
MSSDRITSLAGLDATKTLAHRADILAMTEAASAAVLRPKETGAFSHERRAALAARIAQLNGRAALSDHYGEGLSDQEAKIADPSFDGGADDQLKAILAFTDRVVTSPKDATASDIEKLTKVGIADADIVRLTQLNAFLAYEIRLIEGLRLMGTGA